MSEKAAMVGSMAPVRTVQPPPFSIRVFAAGELGEMPPPLDHLLPALWRSDAHVLEVPSFDDDAFMARQLDVSRLTRMYRWLHWAGPPIPATQLYAHAIHRTEFILADRMEMHLVYQPQRLYVKPLPRWLLEPRFWTEHLACRPGCECEEGAAGSWPSNSSKTTRDEVRDANRRDEEKGTPSGSGGLKECVRRQRWKVALGFLYSYAAMVASEQDFRMAKQHDFLPPEITWDGWRTLIRELDINHIHRRVDKRFHFGELSLSSLNMICRLTQGDLLKGYFYIAKDNQRKSFVEKYFKWLATATVYMAIVLTAMQLGLMTRRLAENDSFQAVSYGFTVFAILGPILAVSIAALVRGAVLLGKLVAGLLFMSRLTEERMREMGKTDK